MRARDMHLSDYGIQPEDEKRLRHICRNLTADEAELLRQAAKAASYGLVDEVIRSLTEPRAGYYQQAKRKYIPVTKDDFYAHQRRTLAKFYDLLRMAGRWKE